MRNSTSRRLVTSLDEVRENIRRYQSELGSHPALVARISRHSAWYAMRGTDDRWLFAPSKFVGYAGMSAKQYLSAYRRNDGRETERVLAEWFQPVGTDAVLGRQLDAELRQFFGCTGKAPNKRKRISVLKSEAGSELGSGKSQENGDKQLLSRISVDPQICGGRPCIRGTRVRVSDILDMMASGVSPDEIVGDYPYLQRDDIAAAIAYAARAVDHRIVNAA